LGSINLLEWLTELRELFTFTSLLKDLIREMNIQMGEMHRARYVGRGVELPCLLQTRPSPGNSTHLEALHTPYY